jgi:hypothetical protein
MKTSLRLVEGFFVSLLLGGFHAALAQPALTISPAVTSNTYPGVIILNITGLTNHETVAIQEWLDLNTNGVIDSGEPLMDAGKITDNDPSKAIIGGVTNLNVPIDSNSTTGAITATLNFAPPLVLENIIGQRIFKLVSPTGNFSPVTATLLVTNAVTAQNLSGIVYSNGITPLANAVVVVLPPDGNGYTAAAVADSNGHYNINVNPGSYAVMAAVPNYYMDQSFAPQVTLTNGMSATNNLSLSNGTVTVSGAFYDTGNSNGIPGLMVQFESGNLFAIGFTDSNGNYSAALAPNFWKVKPAKERLPRRAYVVPQQSLQVDATAGNVTNANVGLPKGNALFYGHIADNLGSPFVNIEFDANDTNNNYDAKGYSDPNGNYASVALADGTNEWNCNPNNAANIALTGYILNNSQNTNIAVGQAIKQDFVALPVNAQISGRVRDNSGNPVVRATLYASTFSSTNSYQSLNSQTDTNGNYSLGVSTGAGGNWGVAFSVGDQHDLAHQGLVDLFGPYFVTFPPTNVLLNITVYPAGSSALTRPQRFGSQQFGFNVAGSVGVSYTLQVTTNLAAGNWAPLYTFQLTNSPMPVTDFSATNAPRFYRLLKN